MLSSLRFRLPLLFLAGIVVAGLVTTVISVQLFRQQANSQTYAQLRQSANGIAQLYSNFINADYDAQQQNSRKPPCYASGNLQKATGGQLFWDGPVNPFPGEGCIDLTRLDLTSIDWTSGKSLEFAFTPPSLTGTYLAVASPVRLQGQPVGAIIVAKRKTDVTQQVYSLVRRLAIALLIGLGIAGLLAWYMSRRIVRPVLQLSRAADEVAAGNYTVEVPKRAAGEIGHLAERFDEMTDRLLETEARERNFLMSVSHELRTPLTAIRGHVSALREGVIDDPELAGHSLEIVELEATRLERLVGDILDLAKLDAHRFTVLHEEVDMRRLVERAYDTFGEQARDRSIDYRLDVQAEPVIVSDGDRVLQIVDNFLSNAFRATPNGGRIELGLGQVNGSIHVSVADTGPGIAAADRERLFRPFVSGGGGTGLGLTIARELSAALGGSIALESEVGRGSRFELLLPSS